MEEYRDEENEIKNALISAQKLSEAAIREARHKAEIILKDAQMKADEKVASIADEVEEKKEKIQRYYELEAKKQEYDEKKTGMPFEEWE